MNLRREVNYRNIALDGHSALRMEKVISEYELVPKKTVNSDSDMSVVARKNEKEEKYFKRLLHEEIKPLSFPLIPVTADQVAMCREKGISSFVYKLNGDLFWAKIPNNIAFISSDLLGGTHKCAVSGNVCQHATAASDEAGGCEKVRNGSCYIERYDWIPTGYETFNTKHDSFLVVRCLKHANCPPRPPRSAAEINALRLSLAQFVWEDVTSYQEVQLRKRRAQNRDPYYGVR